MGPYRGLVRFEKVRYGIRFLLFPKKRLLKNKRIPKRRGRDAQEWFVLRASRPRRALNQTILGRRARDAPQHQIILGRRARDAPKINSFVVRSGGRGENQEMKAMKANKSKRVHKPQKAGGTKRPSSHSGREKNRCKADCRMNYYLDVPRLAHEIS